MSISETDEYMRPPEKEILLEKFRTNRVLTGLERKFCLQLVENYYDDSTSNCERNPSEISNKEVQVYEANFKNLKSTQVQTENLKIVMPNISKSSKMDLKCEGKYLAYKAIKDDAKVDKIMNETFNGRRSFILKERPVVQAVKEIYPLLFTLSEVRNELNRIFYPDKDKEFLANITKYSDVILSLVEENDPILKSMEAKIRKTNNPVKKQYAKEVGALLLISNLLKERKMLLNTQDKDKLWPLESYPRIQAPCKINQLFYDMHIYEIIVEGYTLCEASTFQEAILCVIAAYFIFHISYPETVFNTLVAFEKLFLKADETNRDEIKDTTSHFIKYIKRNHKNHCKF